jgi:hypothetical protein
MSVLLDSRLERSVLKAPQKWDVKDCYGRGSRYLVQRCRITHLERGFHHHRILLKIFGEWECF